MLILIALAASSQVSLAQEQDENDPAKAAALVRACGLGARW